MMEWEIYIMDVSPTNLQQLHYMDQKRWEMSTKYCWVYAMKNQGSSEGEKEPNHALARSS